MELIQTAPLTVRHAVSCLLPVSRAGGRARADYDVAAGGEEGRIAACAFPRADRHQGWRGGLERLLERGVYSPVQLRQHVLRMGHQPCRDAGAAAAAPDSTC